MGQGEPLEVARGDNDLPCPGCPAMPRPDKGLHAPGSGLCSEGGSCSTLPSFISRFLQLPEVQVPPSRRTTLEPLVDYTKSIIMTGDDYIKAMEEKAARNEQVEKDKELKKKEAKLTKEKRAEEKI
jgi:hypothetical protein